jgi:hypothetical protein
MRLVVMILTLALSNASVLAQQSVPPPPQPAPDKPPAASGPSLEVTLKFIQDKVNEQGSIAYTASASNAINGTDLGTLFQFSQESRVIAVDPAGGLFFQEKDFVALTEHVSATNDGTTTWQVNFKDVDKLDVMSSTDYKNSFAHGSVYQDNPLFYELLVHLAAGKTVRQHTRTTVCTKGLNISKQSCITLEADNNLEVFTLHFRDEETANRVAKALVHAVELCGGGPKPEPF